MRAAAPEDNPHEIARPAVTSRCPATPPSGTEARPSRKGRRFFLTLTTAALAACGGDDGPTEPTATLNLTVARAYLVQAVQRPDGSVPLVAGREATVRVFPLANEANTAAPAVLVRLLEDGVPFDSVRITAPGAGVPTALDETAGAWTATIPGDRIRPGLSLEAVVDPDGAVAEASTADNGFPASGALALTVEEAPPLRIRFVSIVNGSETGFVDGDRISDYMALTEKIFPAATFEVDIRIGGVVSAVDDVSTAPGTVLQEVRQLQQTEDPNRIYVGVVADAAWPGGSGLALVGGYAAIIREGTATSRRVVFPHQIGHLMGRRHAPACDAGADTEFPYADDSIGQLGYDDGAVVPADTQDIMSICPLSNPWVSDYTWEAMLEEALARAGG